MCEAKADLGSNGFIKRKASIIDFKSFRTKRVNFSSYSAEMLSLRIANQVISGYRFELENILRRTIKDTVVTDSISSIRRILNPLSPSALEECGRDIVYIQDRRNNDRNNTKLAFTTDSWNLADVFTKRSSERKTEKLVNAMSGHWSVPTTEYELYN